MSMSKITALAAGAALLFGTSLFSRDRANPSWAWASGDASAANLSQIAALPPASPATAPAPAPREPDPQGSRATTTTTATTPSSPPALSQAPAVSQGPVVVPAPGVQPARRTSAASKPNRACAAKACPPPPQRSRGTMGTAEAAPLHVVVEPIQFRLAERGI